MKSILGVSLFVFLGACMPSPRPDSARITVDSFRVVDLTHVLEPGIPLYPGGKPISVAPVASYNNGYYMNSLEFGEHTGTHVDAPAHFTPGAATVDRLGTSDLVAPMVVVDVTEKVARNQDYRVTSADILEWEKRYGAILKGIVVVFRTGWETRWNNPKNYLNDDPSGTLHFPGLDETAARLLGTRKVAAVGVDTLSVDFGPSKDFQIHKILHSEGVYHIENMANLSTLPPTGTIIVVGVLKVKEGSGAPARLFCLVPKLANN